MMSFLCLRYRGKPWEDLISQLLFLCFEQPSTGAAGDTSILVLPYLVPGYCHCADDTTKFFSACKV